MSPIISPIFFYLFSVVDFLRSFCWIVGGLLIGAIVLIAFFSFMEVGFDENTFKNDMYKKGRNLFITGVILILVGGFIPSETACYQMMVSSIITPNNVENIHEEAKNLVDYIIDVSHQLEEVKEDE